MTDLLVQDDTLVPSELDSLKQIADNMGVTYSPNIGATKLKAKIAEKQAPKVAEPVATPMNKRVALKRDATKLVRVRVANMDPSMKSHKGVWAMASNKVVGTLKKFVPFNSEYHVENFLYKVLRDKKWRETYEVPDGKGGKLKKNRFVPSYAIEVLPDLTPKELSALADDQKKRGSIDRD